MERAPLIQYLQDKGIYNPVYESLIDELIYLHEIKAGAKEQIRDKGIVVRSGKYTVANPAIKIYDNCMKNIYVITQKLGLNPMDLSKITKRDEQETDGFDED